MLETEDPHIDLSIVLPMEVDPITLVKANKSECSSVYADLELRTKRNRCIRLARDICRNVKRSPNPRRDCLMMRKGPAAASARGNGCTTLMEEVRIGDEYLPTI